MMNGDIRKTLDSDDEFPDEHNEEAAVPEYVNDRRFEPIQFKWIENKELIHKPPSESAVIRNKTNVETTKNVTEVRKNDGFIINRGVMSGQDLYCLQIIANTSPNNLAWFTNFTIYKDLLSKYRFLHSCLVSADQFKNKF